MKSNNEGGREKINTYKIQNCMWSELSSNSFICQLRNLKIEDPQKAVEVCMKCLSFKDTNIELEDLSGGYM